MRSPLALAIVTLSAAPLAACSDVTAPDTTARAVSATRTAECCPGLRLCLCQTRTPRAPHSGVSAASRVATPVEMSRADTSYKKVVIGLRKSADSR